jgi:hypothetical protein
MDNRAMAGKPLLMLSTYGDLPTNPMHLRECVVCGDVFPREQARKHCEVRCQPSLEQPFSNRWFVKA